MVVWKVLAGSGRLAHPGRFGGRRWRDSVRPAVFQDHELHHGGDASPLMFRGCNQGDLDVRWDPDADDFGFGDGQGDAPV